MTNETARREIESLDYYLQNHTDDYSEESHTAMMMAVKALEQEPCDDVISRKDAEQMFRNIRSHLKPQDYKSAEEFNTRDLMLLNAEQMIHALPSVTQKSGKWHRKYDRIVNDWFWECDKCSCGYQHEYNYCPNCGAKMESEDKG